MALTAQQRGVERMVEQIALYNFMYISMYGYLKDKEARSSYPTPRLTIEVKSFRKRGE